MPAVARGKALVAKLRARADVRDAEALAAYLGRVKRFRRAGMSPSSAMRAARGTGSGSAAKELAKEQDRPADLDDPFAESFADPDSAETPEERKQREYEAKLLRDMEKQERADTYRAITDAGGIQTREDLREEYREIPNRFIRRDGLPGDEMADYLATYYPELGIESENDLLQYFANR